MKDLQEVNSKITYSERHLKALRNEFGKVRNEFSSEEFTKTPSYPRFANIHKHIKEIAKELSLIREALAVFDNLPSEHEDLGIKFNELVLELKAIKQELDHFENNPPSHQEEKEIPLVSQKTATDPSIEAILKEKKRPSA